jgi:hypothetical protein
MKEMDLGEMCCEEVHFIVLPEDVMHWQVFYATYYLNLLPKLIIRVYFVIRNEF